MSTSEDLAAALGGAGSVAPVEVGSSVRGSLTLYLRNASGEVVILPDPLGSGLVYRLAAGQTELISSDLALLVRVAADLGITVRKSLGYLALLVATGSGGLGLTPYEGVEVLDPGTWVKVGPDGATYLDYPETAQLTGPVGDYETGKAEAREDFLTNVRSAANHPVETRICHLTGGSDSRLVAAALRQADLGDRFLYYCMGGPGDPDYDFASGICSGLALEMTSWSGYAEQNQADSWQESMVGTLEATSGALSTLATTWAVPVSSMVLSGGYGEFLRSFYNQGRPATMPGDELAEHMFGQFSMGRRDEMCILAPGHKRQLVAALQKRVDTGVERGVRSDAVLDYLYMTERNRFFVGEISRVLSHSSNRFDPLYSVAAGRVALSMPGEERNANVLGLDLLRELAPNLAAMPFDRERYAGTYEDLRGAVPRAELPKGAPVVHPRPPHIPYTARLGWSFPSPNQEQVRRARELGMQPRLMVTYDIVQRQLPELLGSVPRDELASVLNLTLLNKYLQRPPGHRVIYRALSNLYGALSWYVVDPSPAH
ncbi:hypothetical protein ACQBAT_13925 [Ornithinimicrobium sp. Y1847]|uniref:hypothetical protein n=1 Tax=Ornithinimicrobium sp. Y1847 TaxID=3405419 RepID=UPI003B679269